jgi:hypothetical protein
VYLILLLKCCVLAKVVKTEVEAVQKLVENHLIPFCSEYDCNQFRIDRFWNKECESFIKNHYVLFDKIFHYYSGANWKKKKEPE